MTHRLILVDGFAGTGKSTVAQRLWLQCVGRGLDATWCHEHEVGHPIFEYGELDELLRLSPDTFEARVLAGWRAVAGAASPATARIFEGALFQIPVGVMVAMNAPVARIRAMVLRIDAALAACDASLVYLQRPQQRVALERTGQLRGPQWLTGMIDAVGQSPYGQKHRVTTLDGLAKFYDRQSALIDAVWPKLTMRRLALDVSDGRWTRHQREINTFLAVRPAPATRVDTTDLLGHAGQYLSTTQLPAAITTDGQSLFLQVPATHMLRLLRVGHGHYCVESLPIDVRFDYDRTGRARRFHYESRMVNEVLSDTVWTRA